MSKYNEDDENKQLNIYPNFKLNGRIFPIWILKNFSKYKLPEIIRKDDEDPCQVKTKLGLKKYQEFITSYLDYRSPYHDILLYHGLGSGKTATAINIYNVLYNATSGWNVFLLIKAALHDKPWEEEINKWLSKQDYDHRYSNIKFIHYDSPYANVTFMDAIKNTDSSLKNIFIIDEAHNFIRNVYNNLTSRKGKRAVEIYDYIIQDKQENNSTRVILLSGTPAINKPFEFALLFNLLRPGIFPKSESVFNQYYIDSTNIPVINNVTKNMFQRRIIGLVSYYIGATPDLYATQTIHYVDVKMTKYQTEIYDYYEEIENNYLKMKNMSSRELNTETSYIYTKQCTNFVFPAINELVTGENRPRPSKFKIMEKEMELILKTKDTKLIKSTLSLQKQAYFKMLDKFMDEFDKYLEKIHNKEKDSNNNILNDIENFKKYDTYEEYYDNEKNKSGLIKALMDCSNKFINVIFNTMKSKGPVLIYSNFVLVEGLNVLKIYLKYFGYSSFQNKNSKDYFRYGEFHNDISKELRKETVEVERNIDNKYGKNMKIIMFSPAGAEGISLENIRQVHIMEPYWNEVRITQLIGRAVRICSHKNLPMEERHVDIYRYRSMKYNIKIKEIIEGQTVRKESILIEDVNKLKTIDYIIENFARTKNNLIQTFLDSIKEIAIDCELFKAHNMYSSKYKCFQFNEVSLFDKHIGPAYKENIYEDIKIANGSNSIKTFTIKVKVIKIIGIIDDETNTNNTQNYWYNPDTGVVYDYNLNYPIGKIKYDENDIPIKLDKSIYKIEIIHVPLIKNIK
jgi:ribosomal protein L32E